MHVGDVECVAGRAADEDVAQMEEGEQSPGVLISPTGPETQNALHNSDLRDSHKYMQKQVWGEWIFTGKNSRMFSENKACRSFWHCLL